MAFDQNQYINEYKRENYDRLSILIPKGRKKDIKTIADSKGVSVSQLVVEALETCYNLDLSKY